MNNVFLTAEWKNLVMANYEVDAAVLQPYLPKFTEPDYFNNKCYVSLVGFMFEKVKVKGVSIPFHTHFEEVNLRFYVKHKDGDNDKRGVVFISEIVPKPAIAWVANTLFKERYAAAKMKHTTETSEEKLSLAYSWKWKGEWNSIAVKALNKPAPIKPGTEEAFIFENYYGYSKVNEGTTNEYKVEHPTWNIYPVTEHSIVCDFEKVYGSEFLFLNRQAPVSVFAAEGSAVAIGQKIKLS